MVVSCHLFCATSQEKGKKSHIGGSPREAKLQEKDDCVHEGLYRTSYMMQQTKNTEILAEQQERELPKFLRSWWPLTYSSVSQFRTEMTTASCAAWETAAAYQKILVLDVSG